MKDKKSIKYHKMCITNAKEAIKYHKSKLKLLKDK